MRSIVLVSLLVAAPLAAQSREVRVSDTEALRRALAAARPGDRIRVAPGEYDSIWAEGVAGAAGRPVVVEAADPERPPVFAGRNEGIHLVDPAHVVLRNLVVRGQSGNGINLDDGGSPDTPAHDVRLEKVRVEDVGPRGNHDAIKLSGLVRFELVDCVVSGWGGEGVDLVGCHDGRLEGCSFLGKEGFSTATGFQAKGGSSRIVVRACLFRDAGSRALNLGGSTGLDFFRPLDARAEATDVTVEGCRIEGSDAAVAFVGVDGAVFRRNAIARPRLWVARILQESRGERFVPSRNGVFEANAVVFRKGLRTTVNVGDATAPETFVFRNNAWFCEDDPAASRPRLPVAESGGILGTDPRLDDDLRVREPRLRRVVGPDAAAGGTR